MVKVIAIIGINDIIDVEIQDALINYSLILISFLILVYYTIQ